MEREPSHSAGGWWGLSPFLESVNWKGLIPSRWGPEIMT